MSNINLFAEIDDEQQQNNRSSQLNNGHHYEQKEDELIIFGYSCKLFRDDFSAKAIDRGQSLIPWNGDESVMIDRYDCRGHLSDLTMWDGDLLRTKMVKSDEIFTEEEQRIETECEEERYLSLYQDLDKEALQQEEEWKRFYAEQNTYGQVGLTYDDDSNTKKSDNKTIEEPSQTLDDDDEYEPFYPPEKLQIPYGMDIPESIKLNAVIEKTASFVSTSGLQMEIVLKTKQANNPQFDFLKYDHYLNPYYRHLIVMIKTGKYRPNLDNNNNSENAAQKKKHGTDQNGCGDDEDEAGGSYLHPLLRGSDSNSSKKVEEIPTRTPSVPMNIHNTAYGQLIKKYEHLRQREKVLKANEDEKASSPKLEEMKIDEPSHISSPPPSTNVIPPPPDVKPIIDKLAEYVARNGAAFEKSIRTKNDSRFGFLERDHLHYNYYQFKVQLCLQEILRAKYEEDRRRTELEEQQRVHGKGVKLILKSTQSDEALTPSSCREFHSDDEDDNNNNEKIKLNGDKEKNVRLDEQQDDSTDEFIGPRPPSPEFIEKMRKQERRRDRQRDQLVRDKQEERKRKAELLVQQLLLKNKTTTEVPSSSPQTPPVNPVLVEKLLNVKNERVVSDHYRRSSSRSKYSRRSRSHDRRRRRSSRKRSRTRSKSRNHHQSKRSKTSKTSSSKRKRDYYHHHRRRHHRDSSRSSNSSSTSSSSSSSHDKTKKKKNSTKTNNDEESRSIERRKNPQSTKWDQREPKSEQPSMETTPSADTLISNSTET